ncbi:hypothetical protein [Paenibacillus pini]|uniref:ABC transporter periplasmic binding protein yphF n=1 Tax=Paenibacillus pini JCM 16418 TaxID=1236976 RepID=W7YDP0_9BACL|nr:hypothetical protein [Paenibacillus pini]GAF09045.1 ABC transporter periplasmic binding protein yphF [Paenibacillus pini JCM 16418]
MNTTAFSKRSRRIKKATATMMMFGILILTTTGCLYSGDKKTETRVSYRESVKRIQSAVDDFQKDQGILPIVNPEESTPRYEKFRVDLNQLQKKGFIDEIPKTAFEKGGSAYFVIQNEEKDPTIKVMDLVTVQKVNDVQRAVDKYKTSHSGKLPVGDEVYPGLHRIDLKEAGADIDLKSVYSGQNMEFIVDSAGVVYADYAFDIMQLIDKEGDKPSTNEDLREYLVKASDYVPVKSLPYEWVNDAPVAKQP